MSNYYLCARCENNHDGSWVGIVIDCTEMEQEGGVNGRA